MMHKKVLAITLLVTILIVAITMASITRTYLTTLTGQKGNESFRGNLTAVIYENGSPGPDGTNDLVPAGNTASKLVQVKNMPNPREINAYIRVMLVPVFRTGGSTLAGNMSLNPSGNTVSIAAPNGGTVTLNLVSGWGNNWIYSDGYYYCKEIIHPDELTSALLESVTVSDNSLWNTLQLEVLSDSIQAESGAASIVWGPSIAGQLEQP